MGEARTKEWARQIAMVCLDELVPADDRYRRIDEIVGDWGFVRAAALSGAARIDPQVAAGAHDFVQFACSACTATRDEAASQATSRHLSRSARA